MSAPIAPDPQAGQALKDSLGGEEIDIDPDQLRDLSVQLNGFADTFTALATHVSTIGDTAETEASSFTRDHGPAPIYEEVVASLRTTGTGYSEQLTKLAHQLRSDAAAMVWIADQTETNEADSAANIGAIESDVFTI